MLGQRAPAPTLDANSCVGTDLFACRTQQEKVQPSVEPIGIHISVKPGTNNENPAWVVGRANKVLKEHVE